VHHTVALNGSCYLLSVPVTFTCTLLHMFLVNWSNVSIISSKKRAHLELGRLSCMKYSLLDLTHHPIGFVFYEQPSFSSETKKKGVPSAESSRSVRGLGKGVSGKPYPRLCNTRRPRLEPGTFRSQAVRLYRLHQARPSD